jgi:hypothetical protein
MELPFGRAKEAQKAAEAAGFGAKTALFSPRRRSRMKHIRTAREPQRHEQCALSRCGYPERPSRLVS